MFEVGINAQRCFFTTEITELIIFYCLPGDDGKQ